MPTNPVRPLANDASRHYIKAAEKLRRQVEIYIANGMPPDAAVRLAWPNSGFSPEEMTEQVVDSIGKAVGKGLDVNVSVDAGFRQWALDENVTGNELSLRDNIYVQSERTKQNIVDTLQTQLRENKSWTETARNITPDMLQTKDVLAKKIEDLRELGRSALSGDVEAYKKYQGAIYDAQKYVDTLSDTNASQGKLKDAYQAVIDATEAGTQQALDAALDDAITQKARYNAERIARTEISKAYGKAVKQRIVNDNDAIGMRWELSSVHDDYDICDMYAEADLYNLGEGCYSEDKAPDYPAHPSCMCVLTPIYKSDNNEDWVMPDDEEVDENAQDFIDDLDDDEQESLMGVQGAEDYDNDKDTWRVQAGIGEEKPMSSDIPVEE